MPQNNLLLFVYGTLRRDCPTGAHRQYLQGAKWRWPAKIRGSLFLVDYYPGLALEEAIGGDDTSHWVKGEIYQLENTAQLERLDDYEGCASDSPRPHEYQRRLVEVLLPDEQVLTVWAYIYIGDLTRLPRIPSGDFLQA
ncbi:MAG TPA: gamma-glutamylcyclotransferase family protein [Cellvibrio sp.]|nr:gamma-glutamylcyclotransferase family protein [Cellvibrio sp.]